MNQETVDTSNYHWKSNKIGADEIVIYPDNPKFKHGVYRVAIEAFQGEQWHSIGVKVSAKEAKLVNTLVHGEPLNVQVKDSVFFKYVI